MNKKVTFVTAIIVVIVILGIGLSSNQEARVITPGVSTLPTPITLDSAPLPVEFEASFEIYTNGTKRIFTDPKYHRQSSEVYLTPENSSRIQVKEVGVTWGDFFKTLPLSLTSDCLVTGTKQTFCTTATQKLHFYINEIEVPDALNKEIKKDDTLKVVYGKIILM